ncbi:MAG: ECF transporter S component [Clostridia bacterium]|nr:ECF transporter S component [Clostridia bacterium]
MTVKSKTHRLTLMAMFAALAYIIMAVGRIPISSVDFLKYDPKDVILVISGFILGPMPGLAIAFVVALIEMLTVSSTGPIGFLMNFLSSAAFLWPATALYKRRHTLRGAGVGLAVGVLLMTALMLMWNYFVTPYYMGYPREAVAAMLVPVFLPFNLIKGLLNGAITILVYKPVSRALKKSGLVEMKPGAPAPKKNALGASLIAVLVLVSCIFAVLIMRGII